MILSSNPKQQFLDSNGNPLAGGKLYSYTAGTTTPLATYANSAGATNTNPVILDSSGRCDLWLDAALSYKFKLTDSSDSVIWTVDNVASPAATGVPAWSANVTYSLGQIVQDASGEGVLYVSLTNNNVGNALTSVANWRIYAGHVRTISTSGSATVTDDVVLSNSTSGSVTVTLPACSTTSIGKSITVKDIGTGGNTTSVRGNGTDQVDGAVTYATALSANDSLVVMNTGTAWKRTDGTVHSDGSVTRSKIEVAERTPVGAVMAYAGTGDPTGWLLCDGRAVSRSTYSALFSAVGVTHGQGDNSTTFNIPDYRGRFLRGTDNMGSAAGAASRDPDRASRTAMATGGNTANNVGSVQDSSNAAHTHFAFSSDTSSSLNFPSLSASNSAEQRMNAGLQNDYTIQGTSSTPNYGLTSSSGASTEARPLNAYANFIVKY